MVIERQVMTVSQFDTWVLLPENIEKNYEFISGEIVEVVSNPNSSTIGILIGAYIALFVREAKLGHPTGADGGYKVADERYIPDVGYISYERMPKLLSEEGYVPAAPDLAVEVLSPTDSASNMTVKLGNYLSEGTTVWIVDPVKAEVAVYTPNERVKIYKKTDTLDGGKVLKGFKLPLQNIFP